MSYINDIYYSNPVPVKKRFYCCIFRQKQKAGTKTIHSTGAYHVLLGSGEVLTPGEVLESGDAVCWTIRPKS